MSEGKKPTRAGKVIKIVTTIAGMVVFLTVAWQVFASGYFFRPAPTTTLPLSALSMRLTTTGSMESGVVLDPDFLLLVDSITADAPDDTIPQGCQEDLDVPVEVPNSAMRPVSGLRRLLVTENPGDLEVRVEVAEQNILVHGNLDAVRVTAKAPAPTTAGTIEQPGHRCTGIIWRGLEQFELTYGAPGRPIPLLAEGQPAPARMLGVLADDLSYRLRHDIVCEASVHEKLDLSALAYAVKDLRLTEAGLLLTPQDVDNQRLQDAFTQLSVCAPGGEDFACTDPKPLCHVNVREVAGSIQEPLERL